MTRRHVRIIGLVGLPGAGKTTAAEYLAQKKFTRITLSDFIKEEGKRRGLKEFSREALQNLGNSMREEYGPQVLAQLAHKRIRELPSKKFIVDGIRNLYEVAFFNVENNFTLVGVTAQPKIRYKRLLERNSADKKIGSYLDFLKEEHREDTLGSKEIGLRVRECLKKANYTIQNNRSIKDLYRSLDAIVKTLTLR